MSVDTPPEPEHAPVLRREALLPNERSRGLGTIAVVCTMAGVASGLALATTLMAMQVADSMSVRQCPYRVSVQESAMDTPDHGFLGIRFMDSKSGVEIDKVLANTPAQAVDLHVGDHVLSVDGYEVRTMADLHDRIYNLPPGSQPTIVIDRAGHHETLHPTLTSWPVINY